MNALISIKIDQECFFRPGRRLRSTFFAGIFYFSCKNRSLQGSRRFYCHKKVFIAGIFDFSCKNRYLEAGLPGFYCIKWPSLFDYSGILVKIRQLELGRRFYCIKWPYFLDYSWILVKIRHFAAGFYSTMVSSFWLAFFWYFWPVFGLAEGSEGHF